ncbi:hypothetical protein SELMODRAFT_446519 [Selaginella moellendorffii]|uniref:Pentacotripeptide-repeat region of PRORP domain-containing protein n=2 Tax=Selaginella moellendorffii TaxID=88036 RepID=D8SS49_SELML|nr:hypothetical protein SELMODRAFT_446519 [Selaginella moellendorffii]
MGVAWRMPQRDWRTWQVMIQAYGECGDVRRAELAFASARQERSLTNAMFHAYALNGHLDKAKTAFDSMAYKDVVAWTAMLTAYAQKGHTPDMKLVFDEMPEKNIVSWNAVVAAYTQNEELELGIQAFSRIPKWSVPSCNVILQAYAERRQLSEAVDTFHGMPERDVVSWTALLMIYAQSKLLEEAKRTFLLMPWRTVISWTGMVSAYAHHGILSEARQAFEAMPWKNLVSWNVVLEAYARNVWGCREALALFHAMNLEGMVPDEASFTSILAACAHIGVVSEACGYLRLMNEYSDLRPARGHYNCIVDLLGRTGELAAAEEVIAAMPVPPDAVSWRSLLGACRNHGDSDRGGRAAARVVELDDEDTAVYSLLSELIWQGDREGEKLGLDRDREITGIMFLVT